MEGRRDFLKAVLIGGSALALKSVLPGCIYVHGTPKTPYVYDTPDPKFPHVRQGKQWFYRPYTFTPQQTTRIKNDNFLPPLHPSYEGVNLLTRDSKNRKVLATELVKRSTRDPKARKYVEKGLEKILLDHGEGKIGDQSLALAKYTIRHFWRDISKDKGKGNYSLRLEGLQKQTYTSVTLPPEMKTTITYLNRGDRRQTLGEFISHYSKSRRFVGDCDDFAIALLSVYEIARDMSSQKIGPFWKRLNKEFQHYQVAFAAQTRHAINFIMVYNNDFSEGRVHPIEPQLFDRRYLEQDVVVDDKKKLWHIERIRGPDGIGIKKTEILWFYNSTAAYLKK